MVSDNKKKKRVLKPVIISAAAALAASFVILFVALFGISSKPTATVCLDVNPSLELMVNSDERVCDVVSCNKDGDTIIDGMDLKNTDIKVAVNAVLGSMVKHGYLNKQDNKILLSIDGEKTSENEKLRKKLTNEIDTTLNSMLGAGAVIDQTVNSTDSLKALAEKYNITPGKAFLIQEIVKANSNLDFDALVNMSISDLVKLLLDERIDLREYADYTGVDFEDIIDEVVEEINEKDNDKNDIDDDDDKYDDDKDDKYDDDNDDKYDDDKDDKYDDDDDKYDDDKDDKYDDDDDDDRINNSSSNSSKPKTSSHSSSSNKRYDDDDDDDYDDDKDDDDKYDDDNDDNDHDDKYDDND